MVKNAIITFDYEVFLGRRTGTVENSVLKPTRKILDILTSYNGKAIFFVDTTWLLFIRENFPEDYKNVVFQLKEIVASGSSVELHLHPQWMNASVVNGEIVFESLKNYKLHSLETEQIIALFKRSVELLNEITGRRIRCFRAGGWCIEPFEKLKEAFKICNIEYDFSVLPGMSIREGEYYDYDFEKAPSQSYYRFNNDIQIIDSNGCFSEIPVSTYYTNPFIRVINKVLLKFYNDKIFGDGTGAKEKSLKKSIMQALKISKGMLTLDKTSNIVFRFLINTYFRRSSFIVAVSHPKIISDQALINLSFLVKKYNTLGSNELDDLFRS
jgi:hypothetical protein